MCDMNTIIALALVLSFGWTTSGQDGVVTLTDPVADSITVNASCAAYIYNSGYDTIRNGVNNLSATPEYIKACF